jgi:hypothetical protein
MDFPPNQFLKNCFLLLKKLAKSSIINISLLIIIQKFDFEKSLRQNFSKKLKKI